MSKVLLVEDDVNLGDSLKDFLTREGFSVTLCRTLKKAVDVDINPLELIILDWMLPDGQGIDFLKEIRGKGSDLPIIMLTARTDLIDKVLGLESGANDYLTKPFEPRELLARIRVQLRDQAIGKKSDVDDRINLGQLIIDLERREVRFDNEKVELTKMEFDFLRLLAESPNRAFSREEILNKVWGYNNFPTTRTVDTHVLQLRQKLKDELIETVRGVGYRLRFGD